MHRSLTSKTIPLLIITAVVAPIWYAASNQISLTAAPQAAATPIAHNSAKAANAQLLPTLTTQVQQTAGHVTLSVNTRAYTHVQKVEFYVENQLVGAAYAKPYSVSLDSASLQKGIHQVTAKIYTDTATTETSPTSFISLSQTSTAAVTPEQSINLEPSATPTVVPSSPTSLLAPDNVTAVDNGDGTSATITWNSVNGATSYQVWRDGTQLAILQNTNYIDSGLAAGGSYDYQVVATNDTQTSDLSAIAAVTISSPSQSNTGPDSQAQSISPDASPAYSTD